MGRDSCRPARRRAPSVARNGAGFGISKMVPSLSATVASRRRPRPTYPAVAARAGVSRTFLYYNDAARRLLTDAVSRAQAARARRMADADSEQETSSRARALNAEDAVKATHAEIHAQRRRIPQPLAQLRPADPALTDDTAHRITTH